MAHCSNCGVSVGCGCQLTNGLCSTCLNKQAEQSKLATAPTKIPLPPPGQLKN